MNNFIGLIKIIIVFGIHPINVNHIGAFVIELADQNSCSKELIGYKQWPQVMEPEWTIHLQDPNSGGILVYEGVHHSFNSSHPQYDRLVKLWTAFKPTISFYEGTGSGFSSSLNESIKKSGEPGLIRFLASKDKIEARSLEPPKQLEINHLLNTFSADQVMLFYVLRNTVQLRERRSLNIEKLQAVTTNTLKHYSKYEGLNSSIANFDELDKAVEKYWPDNDLSWWQFPSNWFSPTATSKETGSVFTNEVNRVSSEYRDKYMFEKLTASVLAGHRVFGAVGRNHVAMQSHALRCAIDGNK
ncbi:MAG: hypothetical protein D8M58_17695 [Calditrichaeota bacterium]|nr:MAG: hypothetical protein DWQ03_01610 [Calditrichota bacterium]MBL1207241.1 hypothetical protein [Calditrichota bacterium]NOG47074.1 hypothetical protein [Calditrichota bacterium]